MQLDSWRPSCILVVGFYCLLNVEPPCQLMLNLLDCKMLNLLELRSWSSLSVAVNLLIYLPGDDCMSVVASLCQLAVELKSPYLDSKPQYLLIVKPLAVDGWTSYLADNWISCRMNANLFVCWFLTSLLIERSISLLVDIYTSVESPCLFKTTYLTFDDPPCLLDAEASTPFRWLIGLNSEQFQLVRDKVRTTGCRPPPPCTTGCRPPPPFHNRREGR